MPTQTIRVLQSGRHCACAVTMGVSLDEMWAVLAAQRASGKNYMMMETVVYSREYPLRPGPLRAAAN